MWHMFAAEMVQGCGIGAWETNSRIVRATSPTAGGKYTVQAVIKPSFAHEPVLVRAPASGGVNGGGNGDKGDSNKWLLYSIGNGSSSVAPRKDCQGGYTPTKGGGGFHGPVPVEVYESRYEQGFSLCVCVCVCVRGGATGSTAQW